MARARNIKPGFYLNEQLAGCSLLARYIFPGLWMQADRRGRLEDRPLRLKAAILPYDSGDMNALLDELAKAGLILRYREFIQILGFEKHQNPHIKEAESIIPAPDEHHASTVQAPGKHQCSPADSLNLIPDSLGKTLSGKPDVLPPAEKDEHPKAQARQLIDFLNAKAGKAFRQTDANLEPIVARIKEGYTLQDLKTVTARKCREWAADEKMVEYLRPATLYNRTKFNQYIGECVEEQA